MKAAIRNNARRCLTVLRREIGYVSPRPIEVNIELTHRCNLRCRMCGVWGKKNEGNEQELTLDEYARLFIQMKNLGVRLVTLAGGEPFMRKDLLDIIAAAKSQGLICNLFSNGTLIGHPAIGNLFDSGVDKIIISVDGIGPVHDAVRGIRGSFDKTMTAIADMAAERRTRKTNRPEIDVHMTLLKENLSCLSQLQKTCDSLGVNFSYQPYSEISESVEEQTQLQGATIGSDRYLPHNESLRFTMEQVTQIRKEILPLTPSFYSKLLLSFTDEQLQQGLMPLSRCYITRTFMMLDPYGNVFPCTNLDGYVVGSTRNQTLANIWEGVKYEALRKSLSKQLLPICNYCCHCSDNLSLSQLLRIVLA